ncbi:MAG: GNAT family N-acetyltransferase [Promethearchaeota archaeon]
MELLSEAFRTQFVDSAKDYYSALPLSKDYIQRLKRGLAKQMEDPLKEYWIDIDENGSLRAFVGMRFNSNFSNSADITEFYVHANFLESGEFSSIAEEIVLWSLDKLKHTGKSLVGVNNRLIEAPIIDIYLTHGFSRISRQRMTLPVIEEGIDTIASNITALPVPPDFSLQQIQGIARNNPIGLSELMYEYSKNTADALFIPFLQSQKLCEEFVPLLISGEWGDYQQDLNLFLFHQQQLIGVIFFTLRNDDVCYIPDIGIIPAYQGQGLGKMLLINGLDHVLKLRPSTQAFELDVTLPNKAFHLYESLGFAPLTEYDIVFRNQA